MENKMDAKDLEILTFLLENDVTIETKEIDLELVKALFLL